MHGEREARGRSGAATNILVVVGTRPEAIKLIPVILALRECRHYQPTVIATSQHHEMVVELFDLAQIEIDTELWVGPPQSRLNEIVPAVMQRFDDYCRTRFGDKDHVPTFQERQHGYPAAVIVHGDTSSAMAAALAAFHLRIPVIHAEAGLRTGGNILTPFPEELNRQVIACIAAFHLAPTPRNQENLVRETIPIEQIFVTGNTGIDALRWASEHRVPYADPRIEEADRSDARIVTVTAHRRENWGGGLERIAAAVAKLAERNPDVIWVVPQHPNPAVRRELGPALQSSPNVLLTEPVGYAAFARLMARSHIILTDSGGIQEEAPALGKPVVVLRDSTERTEGVEAGTLVLAGTDPDRVVTETENLLGNEVVYRRMAEAINPYGDGRAAERIVAALENLTLGGLPPVPFGSGYSRLAVLRAAGYEGGLDPRAVPPADRGDIDIRGDRSDHWHP